MQTNALRALDCTEQTEKRAQWEGFEFAVAGDTVRVTNGSHDDPDEHTYEVQLDARNIPTSCTCPAYEYHPGACKHMAAVAIREPVLEAARSQRSFAADGGGGSGAHPGPSPVANSDGSSRNVGRAPRPDGNDAGSGYNPGPEPLSDGGIIVADDEGEILDEDTDDDRPDDCECDDFTSEPDIPCFACWRAGFDTPAIE